jgi:hypothetical protein
VISDTHGQHQGLTLPEGDVLIHAGDFTRFGLKQDAIDFNEWLGTLPFSHKLVVLGNHEALAPWVSESRALLSNATFLCDSGVSLPLSASSAVPSLHVWGTAFYWPKEGFFQPPFAAIPAGVDVLISHGPAASHVDGGAGCKYLLEHIERIQPQMPGDVAHDGFDQEHALRPAKAAKRGVALGVGFAAVRSDVQVAQEAEGSKNEQLVLRKQGSRQ